MSEYKTGKIRFRHGWFGRLILQYEYKEPSKWDGPGTWDYRWRDMKIKDLIVG